MRLISIILLAITTTSTLFSYPRRIIDMHSAQTLKKAQYTVDSRIMPPGGGTTGAGVLMGMDFGVTERFEVGVSYGADGLVGRGDIDWYYFPGAHLKFRLIDETYEGPAFSLGIDMQGFGGKAPDYRGFVYKSAGFFGVVSKGFGFTKNVGIDWHLMINYSLEDLSNVNWPNAMLGMDLSFPHSLYYVMEYDFAFNQRDINESEGQYGGPHRGFLSLGIKWLFLENYGIQFDIRDIFQQRLGSYRDGDDLPHGWGRELMFNYVGSF